MNTKHLPILTLAFAVLLQFVGFAWYLGSLSNRVTQLEATTARIEQQLEKVIEQGQRISTLEAFVEDLMQKVR